MTYKMLLFLLASDAFKDRLDEDVTISVDGEYYKATIAVCNDGVLDDGHIYLKEDQNE